MGHEKFMGIPFNTTSSDGGRDTVAEAFVRLTDSTARSIVEEPFDDASSVTLPFVDVTAFRTDSPQLLRLLVSGGSLRVASVWTWGVFVCSISANPVFSIFLKEKTLAKIQVFRLRKVLRTLRAHSWRSHALYFAESWNFATCDTGVLLKQSQHHVLHFYIL